MKDAAIDEAMTRKTKHTKPRMPGSTGSTGTGTCTPPKDVLELGRVIVRQLEIDTHGELLSRWMAHHLAELIQTAEHGNGIAKQIAEKQAVELILKLWANRRTLPTTADPMSGHQAAIKVLAAMLPTADPWSRFRRTNSNDDLLHEMFGVLVQLIMGGLLLTRPVEERTIEDTEWSALSDEEQFIIQQLGRWKEFLVTPAAGKCEIEDFYAGFMDSDTHGEVLASEELEADTGADDPDPDAERRVMLSNLETFQAKLATLIEQWRITLEADSAGENDEEE